MNIWSNYSPTSADDEPSPTRVSWLKKLLLRRTLVLSLIVILVASVSILSYLGWKKAIDNEGYEWQRNTLTLYNQVQIELSTCLDNTRVSVQIAEAEYLKLREVLMGIISAQYTDANGNPQDAQVVFEALKEAYPSISGDTWKQIITIAVGCRNQVAGAQNKLQAYAGRFDIWTHQGNLLEGSIRNNWPTNDLKVMGLNGELRGREALDFIVQPILSTDAEKVIRAR